MPEPSADVQESRLWRRMAGFDDLRRALLGIRTTAELLAERCKDLLPDYTDHSVRHMDALWRVADVVLLENESSRITPAEAFVLGASFYAHDLGLAIGATHDGTETLKATDTYHASLQYFLHSKRYPQGKAEVFALRESARESHAAFAGELACNPIPGLNQYLIESAEVRHIWARFIGDVSASHNWSLRELESRLGHRNTIPEPLPRAGGLDLGYVACLLRVIDFAHVNHDRADLRERALRESISAESTLHWRAQEFISGPSREANTLVYASVRAIEDPNAWWLFYDMIRALQVEIEGVHDYLESRSSSKGRFALHGVKRASSPREFSAQVETSGFEPIDVRFRPDSMERLIGILGGRTLYGDDDFAPLRELLQNSADAVRLRMAIQESAKAGQISHSIRISIEQEANAVALVVADSGVGMSERIATNYLLGIASDYWHSPDFYADYPMAGPGKFKSVGRFGIGFLSVFMLGTEVAVDTQQFNGGDALSLTLQGVGQRGTLRRRPTRLESGTTVRVTLSEDYAKVYAQIRQVVQARVPMLDVPIQISEGSVTTDLAPGWWKDVGQEDFIRFISERGRAGISRRSGRGSMDSIPTVRALRDLHLPDELSSHRRWPGRQPEIIDERCRVLAAPGWRQIVLCSKGFAITTVPVPGLLGMVDEPDLEVTAARTTPLRWDPDVFRTNLLERLDPSIQAAVNALVNEANVPARYGFLASVAAAYGQKYLTRTSLPWISVVEAPGSMMLVTPAQLIEKVQACTSLVIGYGVSPWSIASVAREHFRDIDARGLLIPVSAVDQIEVRSGDGYEDRQKPKTGPLRSHFTAPSYSPSEDVFERAHLLKAILNIIASAWAVSEEDLEAKEWSSKAASLIGRVPRS